MHAAAGYDGFYERAMSSVVEPIASCSLVVFGEFHGTTEVPAFLADVLAASRPPVALAIEWPRDLQPAVDDFLATGDRTRLLAAPHDFWSYRDGRSSAAMLALVDRARQHGAPVICFDDTFPSAEDRDAGMAALLLAALPAPPTRVLVLCGNLHAQTSSPRWMGWHLRRRVPDLLALDARDDGGTAWACLEDRGPGVVTIPAPPHASPPGIRLHAVRDEDGFDGEYAVGPISASLPVR